MPFKHNAARRHRISKMKFKILNWAEYEAGLRRRGTLILWITEDALRRGKRRSAGRVVASRVIPIWRLRPP